MTDGKMKLSCEIFFKIQNERYENENFVRCGSCDSDESGGCDSGGDSDNDGG